MFRLGRLVPTRGGVPFGVVTLMLWAVLVSAAPGVAEAEVFGEPIGPVHSGLCLTVEGASTAQGAPVVQAPCDGSDAQTWTATATGAFWKVRVAHSNLCLDVEGGTLERGGALIQWPCTAGTNQEFAFATGADGTTTITARHSSLCLDIEGAGLGDGAALIQWSCHGGTNQRFQLGDVGDVGALGRWSPRIDLPLVPVAASALNNGNILMWSAYDRFTFGGDRGYTQTLVYNPTNQAYSERQVSNTGHDMFCPGIANLPDGRILVNGGSSSAETSIYNPATDSWEDAADMNIPRGYQGTTLLADGSAFTLGGSWSGGQGNKDAEIWEQGSGWRRLSGVPAEPFTADDPQGVYRGDNHLWLFAWTGDRVFHAGPTRAMHWIGTEGNGSVTAAGDRGADPYAMNGTAVMYEPGRILTTGGAQAYQGQAATNRANVIDITGSSVTTRTVGAMAFSRAFHHSVVLPSGEVVVVGGQRVPQPFTDTDARLAVEIWNPDTETFSTGASMAVPRTYHSFALLQPDGRVLVGGGGLCGNCNTNHPDVEVFTPPYLLNEDGSDATRPRIISAPDSLDLDEGFEVTTNTAVDEFVLVRMASATHSVNNDQRRIPLAASAVGNLRYRMTAPTDPGVAVPGPYLLFALDAAGVPSEASIVTITTERDPGQSPGTASGTVTEADGSPVAGLDIDLFTAEPDGSRGTWLSTATTAGDGTWSLPADPGDYILTFIAPTGRTFTNTSPWFQRPFSLASGQTVTGLDATLSGNGGGDASLGGTVTDTDGNPRGGVAVDLFTAAADGSRGAYLTTATTNPDGTWTLPVQPGCYVLTFIAPTGETFTNGSRWFQPSSCADPGQSITGINATLS